MHKELMIVKGFLKKRLAVIIGYAIIAVTFYLVTALYGYDNSIANMFYAVVLTAFAGVCYGVWDYLKYRYKCNALLHALYDSNESDYRLPEPVGLEERLYHEISCRCMEEKRKLICELDEKKRDMADYYTMWTHQIKTPIAALRLLLQREQEMKELFKIEQYTEMALHYARLDSMSSDMLFIKHDVNVIIKHAVKKYAVLFIGSGLSFSIMDFECMAVTDEKWLSFVLEQILSNAIKYTQRGAVRIYGADASGKESSGKVKFVVVEDTGIGIRESDLPRIFERGFTGYNGRMQEKSTGIGLYLCRQIMDRLSHTIRVESVQGQGTRVILGFVQEEATAV